MKNEKHSVFIQQLPNENMECSVSLPSTEACKLSVRLLWTLSWSSLLLLGVRMAAALTDAVVVEGGLQRVICVIPSVSSSLR